MIGNAVKKKYQGYFDLNYQAFAFQQNACKSDRTFKEISKK